MGKRAFWDLQGLRRVGAGASFASVGLGAPFAFGSSRLPQQERGGLLRFGSTEAQASRARRPLSLCDNPRPHCKCAVVSIVLGSTRPLTHGPKGHLRFGSTEASAA